MNHRAAWLLIAALALPGCKKGDEPSGGTSGSSTGAGEEKAPELPALVLADDTKDLLLTWVDEQGDFHVVQTIAEVPDNGKNPVRVVVTTKTEGTGELVYVTDLSKKRPDGTYEVKTMTRAQWEEIGASKRTARLEALAPKAGGAASAQPGAGPGAAAAEVVAVVYGADWCKPCHDAEHLLKQLGANVTKKNIEKSAAARREMEDKLRKAGRPPSESIPIIDVAGTVLVGFSPTAVKRAVDAARRREAL